MSEETQNNAEVTEAPSAPIEAVVVEPAPAPAPVETAPAVSEAAPTDAPAQEKPQGQGERREPRPPRPPRPPRLHANKTYNASVAFTASANALISNGFGMNPIRSRSIDLRNCSSA